MMRAFLKNLRLPRLRAGLFAIMFLLVLMLGSRLSDVTRQIAHGTAPDAFAPLVAETADATKDAPPPAPESRAEAPSDARPEAAPAAAVPEAAPAMEDATLTEPENYSDAEVTILKKLSERRQELDKRGREVDQREALLRVTEQRVDKKIGDLRAMQEQIRKVLGDADKAQAAQEASMVKIYETMKPKDAAKIFENLDLPVLMSVVSRMKEARVAPILGEMDPVKAKELTTALMEKKPLPPAP